MSKKINKFLVFIALAIMFPFVMTLTGCGATPVNSVNAVHFESNLYDEETGYAIYEVDLNEETVLDFKVNPSSWSGYPQTYSVIKGGEQESDRNLFKLKDGKVTVLSPNFKEIIVEIHINGLTDTCIIRLKEYPTEIFLDSEATLTKHTDYINAGGVYTAHVYGKFNTTKTITDEATGETTTERVVEIRELSDEKYKFNVQSSDDTVINILDSSRLKVCSLKQKIESAVVTISLLDTTGKVKGDAFVLKLNLNVVLSPKSSMVYFEGFDTFINSDETIDIDLSNPKVKTETIYGSEYYCINYIMELFDNAGVYISKEEYDVECSSNQFSFIIIDNENQTIKIRKPSNSNELSAEIKFLTSANKNTGEVYMMKFTVKFKFPE